MDKATNSAGNGPKIDNFPRFLAENKKKKFLLQNVPQFCPNSAGNGPEISQKLAFGRARDAQKCLGWAFRLSPRPGPSLIPNTYMEKVTIQYICPFLYSTLYQFLRGLEGSHRLTTQKVPGSNLSSARKIFFSFFNFFLDLAKISTKPKVDFRDAPGFYDWKSKFRL